MTNFKPEKGFETSFMVDAGERKFLQLWKLIEMQPESKIMYDCRYERYAGVAKVTFEISSTGEQTRLTVTHEIIEDFYQNIPEFIREKLPARMGVFYKKKAYNLFSKFKSTLKSPQIIKSFESNIRLSYLCIF